MVIPYRRFGTTYGPHLQESRMYRHCGSIYLPYIQGFRIYRCFGSIYQPHLQGSRIYRCFGSIFRPHLQGSRIYRRLGTTYPFNLQGSRDGTNRLSRNVCKELPLLAAHYPRRVQFSATSRQKPDITQGPSTQVNR